MSNLSTVLLSLVSLVFRPGTTDPEDPRVLMAHRAVQSITIDGVLNESDWLSAPAATDFLQYEPSEGAPPSQKTEVRILYGDNSIYIGAYLYDDHPDEIWRTLGRRDEFNKADWFFISIDSYLNRKSAYTFGVNAGGIQMEGITTRELNSSWDAVWDSAVRIASDGWVVEMQIPYSMLRFSEADTQSWGLNFKRVIPRSGETLEWALVKRTERDSGVVSKYGELHGLEQLRPRRNFQVTPYSVSKLITEEGNPGERIANGDLNVGADLKIGLTSNITLDMTVNPDFGQVESDPAELNLTAFETFFREKRPFFVEGSQTLDFSLDYGSSLLYTRRIGGADPIIGASKLSGRTDGGLQFGVLGAATGANFNPSHYYGVTRVRQELGRNSSIGGMVTLYNTNETNAGLTSFVGGTDWDIRMADNSYRVNGFLTMSNRQFEDPLSDDSQGFAASANIGKVKGSFTYSANAKVLTDGFNPNDIGRIREVDYVSLMSSFEMQLNGGRPFGSFQRGSIQWWFSQSVRYTDGIDRGLGSNLHGNLVTNGYEQIEFSVRADNLLGGYDITETRGLGPWAAPRELSVESSVKTDSRNQWQLEPGAKVEIAGDGRHGLQLKLQSSWNAGTQIRLSADVTLNRTKNRTSWAANQSFMRVGNEWMMANASDAPDGFTEDDYFSFQGSDQLGPILDSVEPYEDTDTYYVPVFGKRDTQSIDFTLRSNVTFSPNLSLQVYGQLFTARGKFADYGILQTRDQLVDFDAYAKRHDFAFSSFQTNTVLRWEYRPGSTLFLVWTHTRNGSVAFDPFDLTAPSPYETNSFDQVSDTFNVFPTNVFLIKLNYLFLR